MWTLIIVPALIAILYPEFAGTIRDRVTRPNLK
jgi:hypothetical protein